ncbi:C protein [Mossman virus]|uniref:C protein n=1 Tax=Mossman virus TaxID=241630 RepID=Q6WGM3_9MONO|nr:C protein [Mossman virus]AAQ23989.1 C protein [Mossman virus]
MPSKFWQSLKRLRVPSRKRSSESDSTYQELQPQPPQIPLRPRVKIGVRRNPDLVGVERSNKAQHQVLALDLLNTLKEMEMEYPMEGPMAPFRLEYSTLQFVKTILMRVSEGHLVTSCWARQVELNLCQTQQEIENLHEAISWVKMMMQDNQD